jgi:hypothetical protein
MSLEGDFELSMELERKDLNSEMKQVHIRRVVEEENSLNSN